MAYLDPNILRIPQMPTPVEQMGQAYQLGEFVQKRQERELEQQESALLQQLMQEGANPNTPKGLADILEKSKGKIRFGTTQKLLELQQNMQLRESQLKEAITKGQIANIDLVDKKMNMLGQIGGQQMRQFQEDEAKFGRQKAEENFKENWPKQVQSAGQLGVFKPEELQEALGWNINTLKNKVEGSEYWQKLRKDTAAQEASDVQALESGLGKEAAHVEYAAKKYGKDSPQYADAVKAQKAAVQSTELGLQEKRAGIAKHYADIEKAKAGIGDATSFEMLPPDKQELAKTIASTSLITGKNAPARGGGYMLQQMGLTELAKEFGTSVSELQLAGMDVKTQLQAKPQVEKRVQALQRAENQLEQEMPVLEDAMKKLSLPSIPLAARGKIAVLRQMGDPAVATLDQAADTVFKEFETVITGNPGAMYVANMEDAKSKYAQVQTPEQMRAWIAGARRIIKNAKSANMETRREIMEGIRNSLHMGKSLETTAEPQKPSPAKSAAPSATTDIESILSKYKKK